MNIAVFGADGRIGSRVCELAIARGHKVFKMEKNDKATVDHVDAAIDFSVAEATGEVCDFCRLHRCVLVTGVTGRTEKQQKMLENLRKTNTVEERANFSKGISAMEQICNICAPLHWDCALTETHRKGKLDAPSGTAKQLASIVAQNGTPLVEVHSLRLGNTIGKHQLIFCGDGETLTITHTVQNIDCFALGALELAEKNCRSDFDRIVV